jgi:hypothetical protein
MLVLFVIRSVFIVLAVCNILYLLLFSRVEKVHLQFFRAAFDIQQTVVRVKVSVLPTTTRAPLLAPGLGVGSYSSSLYSNRLGWPTWFDYHCHCRSPNQHVFGLQAQVKGSETLTIFDTTMTIRDVACHKNTLVGSEHFREKCMPHSLNVILILHHAKRI